MSGTARSLDKDTAAAQPPRVAKHLDYRVLAKSEKLSAMQFAVTSPAHNNPFWPTRLKPEDREPATFDSVGETETYVSELSPPSTPEIVDGYEDFSEESGFIRIKLFRGHKDACTSCQFCGFHEEQLLTAGEDAAIKLWDFESGTCLHTYADGHSMSVTKARTGPDNRLMVSSGWDKKVNMWDLETGKVVWTGQHEGMVTCCNFSHDGKYVVSGSDFDNSLKVWDAFSGDEVAFVENFHTSTISSCMFNPHDDRVVTTSMDMSAKFFDLKTHCNTITLKNHINIVSDASFTTDERKLATVSWDKSIAYYDISTGMYRSDGPVMQEKAHEGCVSCCDFSEDGLTLATGGYDMCVCLWDVDNNVQKLKLQGHTDWIEDIVISKNGNWLMTAARDKTVRVWNIENADNIPMVQQKKKNIGLSMFKCGTCGKPFSLSEDDTPANTELCVFCRLEQVRERDALVEKVQA